MIEPPSFKSGNPFCAVNNAPFTLTSKLPVEVLFGDFREGNEFADAGRWQK